MPLLFQRMVLPQRRPLSSSRHSVGQHALRRCAGHAFDGVHVVVAHFEVGHRHALAAGKAFQRLGRLAQCVVGLGQRRAALLHQSRRPASAPGRLHRPPGGASCRSRAARRSRACTAPAAPPSSLPAGRCRPPHPAAAALPSQVRAGTTAAWRPAATALAVAAAGRPARCRLRRAPFFSQGNSSRSRCWT